MNTVPHEAILASAGSGKTFQLAHRYIRLLAFDVAPDRIIAITFSRKAAGEIFTAIVMRLCEAATNEKIAAETARHIQQPEFTCADFLKLLRRFLTDLQRLHISTIDSFIVGILRAFPMELGIAPSFDVMDHNGPTAEKARADTLNQLFRPEDMRIEDEADLYEAFKQATFGREEKNVAAQFAAFIEDYHLHYKLLHEQDAWGNPARIWKEGFPWTQDMLDPDRFKAELKAALSSVTWDAFAANKWDEFLPAFFAHEPGKPWDNIKYLADRLLPFPHHAPELKLNRTTYPIPPDLFNLFGRISHHLMFLHIRASLETTRGMFRLLNRYEQRYDALVRRRGRITFDDAPYLILRGGRALSRSIDDPTRLFMDYRLDSQLDHWLIDEFQDTSDLQWEVFRNLADEVIQDASGQRSFFFVGDVKQAIYAWRGGNHKLFGQILDYYGTTIERRKLQVSYRSGSAIIDTLNRAFSTLPDAFSPSVQQAWTRYWDTHSSSNDKRSPPGYATYVEVGEKQNDRQACYQGIAEVLNRVQPVQRGLTTAVLVRKNSTALELADYVRRVCPGLPVTVDGQSAVMDNTVVRVLLSLIRYASHPDHTLALGHVLMSPLQDAVLNECATLDELPGRLLDGIYASGYKIFLQTWGEALQAAQPLDPFGWHRYQELLEAAGDYDLSGRRDPDEFISYIENYSVSEQAAESTVRIMTVHKSKGLGFDLVLIPDVAWSEGMTSGRLDELHIARDAADTPEWALLMPRKEIRAVDPVLSAENEKESDENTFESLCVLYVALTRAKRALYLFTTPPPASGQSITHAAFLRNQLAGDAQEPCIYECGDPDWYLTGKAPKERAVEPSETWPAQFAMKASKRRRLLRVSPSSRSEEKRSAHLLFMPSVNWSLELGTAVHALFERVEWMENSEIPTILSEWREATNPDEALAKAAAEHFVTGMESAEFKAALTRPGESAQVWRERSFEAVLDQQWVSGTFDRVVLVRDAKGRLERAEILDYKTNEITDDASLKAAVVNYRPQLMLYASALSKLTGLPAHRITLKLLFTRYGKVADVS